MSGTKSHADDGAANLQSRLTVKEAAEIMNVSMRSVYMAAKVLREAPDLVPLIKRGSLSVHRACTMIDRRNGALPKQKCIPICPSTLNEIAEHARALTAYNDPDALRCGIREIIIAIDALRVKASKR